MNHASSPKAIGRSWRGKSTSSGRRGAVWLATLLLLGASGATVAVTVDDEATEFSRAVYPFEVLDADGVPYAHPLLGGYNLPRPQLVDIDGDGDQDLFVQEYSDALMFFEQVGSGAAPRYRWRTDKFRDLDIGEWYFFVDADADGDFDLLAETRFSLIRYWRNDGSPTDPQLTLVTEKLLDVDSEPMFSDRQNIPKLVDIDCDGHLDLMVGRVEGTITRYETDHFDDAGAPVFRKVGERFQNIEIVGQAGLPGQIRQRSAANEPATAAELGQGPARPTFHGANTMAFEDIDGDGDQDLFWGDFFEAGLLLIENQGSCRSPSMRAEPRPYPLNKAVKTSGYNAPAFGDLDGDGDADLLLGVLGGAFNPANTSIDNLLYLENTGTHRFSVRTRRYVTQLDVGSESFPAFADIDADGDLDLFLGNKIEPGDTKAGRLFWFENIGSASAPRLQLRGPVEQFASAYHYAPAFGDLDADGDLDMVMGTWDDELQLVRNDGSSTAPDWVIADPATVTLSRGRNATPVLGDLDADGDLDLLIGESSGQINYYRNAGSASEARFELVADKYLDIDVGRRSAPTLSDIDEDGDLDLLVGSEGEGLALYRNNGSREAPIFELDPRFVLQLPPFVTPTFADIDADGRQDLFTGTIGGGLIHYARRKN